MAVRAGRSQETLCRCHGTVDRLRSGGRRRRAGRRFSGAAGVVVVSAAAGITAVVLGAHLRVHRRDVEQHARLFESDRALSARRDGTTERIVPIYRIERRLYSDVHHNNN